jgi:hypothetical protein
MDIENNYSSWGLKIFVGYVFLDDLWWSAREKSVPYQFGNTIMSQLKRIGRKEKKM